VPGRLLPCTDGLWRCLPTAEELRSVLTGTRSSGDGLLAEARAPTGYTLEAGGHDDVTALLIPVPAAVPRRRP